MINYVPMHMPSHAEMYSCRSLRKISGTMSIQGTPHATVLSEQEQQLFTQEQITVPAQLFTYRSLLLHKSYRTIIAQSRSNAVRRNNSCVLYRSGCGLLQKIVGTTDTIFLIINEFEPANFPLCSDDVTNAHVHFNKHFLVFKSSIHLKLVPIAEVMDKCVFLNLVNFNQHIFVSFLPNHSELE